MSGYVHTVIRPIGAPITPDPRLASDDYVESPSKSLFDEDTEKIHPVGPDSCQDKRDVDPDEAACSLKLIGYPNWSPVERAADYFSGMARLRKLPERLPGMTTETVVVTFNNKKDLEFALDWFKDKRGMGVAGCGVWVERVVPKEEVVAAKQEAKGKEGTELKEEAPTTEAKQDAE
eukprot:GFKZ01005804.1.p1 GENE.GFKZ01005804.1~~GFKZ01005804.1.p1  ORF type:complete len:176 (-),score=23.52 GFKZ01005804.1:341-868(-)